MDSQKIMLTAFVLVALVQLYVPAKMIWDKETILEAGLTYKFKTAPIDPNDPFRGKYITLSFDENTVTVSNEEDWTSGEMIYLSLTTDNSGFAKIKSTSKKKPVRSTNFIQAKVKYVLGNGTNKLTIDYPFDRYYMEESKAYDAEQVYRQSLRDTCKITYALIKVKDGDAALKDVMINGTSIREMGSAKENKE